MLHAEGFEVSGSDLKLGKFSDSLSELGITLYEGHNPKNITVDVEAVIRSRAVGEDNPEICWAREQEIPVLERG